TVTQSVLNKANFGTTTGLRAQQSIKLSSRCKLCQLNRLKRNFQARAVLRLSASLFGKNFVQPRDINRPCCIRKKSPWQLYRIEAHIGATMLPTRWHEHATSRQLLQL